MLSHVIKLVKSWSLRGAIGFLDISIYKPETIQKSYVVLRDFSANIKIVVLFILDSRPELRDEDSDEGGRNCEL